MNWKWLAEMPNTQAQLAGALLLAFGTGARVIALGWEPSEAWLLFILGLGGIGTVGYLGKRMTDTDYRLAKQGIVPPAGETPAPPPGEA